MKWKRLAMAGALLLAVTATTIPVWAAEETKSGTSYTFSTGTSTGSSPANREGNWGESYSVSQGTSSTHSESTVKTAGRDRIMMFTRHGAVTRADVTGIGGSFHTNLGEFKVYEVVGAPEKFAGKGTVQLNGQVTAQISKAGTLATLSDIDVPLVGISLINFEQLPVRAQVFLATIEAPVTYIGEIHMKDNLPVMDVYVIAVRTGISSYQYIYL